MKLPPLCSLCGHPRDEWESNDNPWRCYACGAFNRVVVELTLVKGSGL